MKEYRFFYHYNKHTGKMSVHFKKKCYIVDDVECLVPCRTKWSIIQPKLRMIGWAKEVDINNNKATIV